MLAPSADSSEHDVRTREIRPQKADFQSVKHKLIFKFEIVRRAFAVRPLYSAEGSVRFVAVRPVDFDPDVIQRLTPVAVRPPEFPVAHVQRCRQHTVAPADFEISAVFFSVKRVKYGNRFFRKRIVFDVYRNACVARLSGNKFKIRLDLHPVDPHVVGYAKRDVFPDAERVHVRRPVVRQVRGTFKPFERASDKVVAGHKMLGSERRALLSVRPDDIFLELRRHVLYPHV